MHCSRKLPVQLCGNATAGWAVYDFAKRLARYRDVPVVRFGRLFEGMDVEAINICQFEPTSAARIAASRVFRPRLAPLLRQSIRQLVTSKLGGRFDHCVHVRSGKGETPDYVRYIEAAVRPLVDGLRGSAPKLRPLVFITSDLSWAELKTLMDGSKVPFLMQLCRLARSALPVPPPAPACIPSRLRCRRCCRHRCFRHLRRRRCLGWVVWVGCDGMGGCAMVWYGMACSRRRQSNPAQPKPKRASHSQA